MNLPKPIKFEVERYVGGLSQFKKIENPIKLSANESALGASPQAIEAFEKEKNKLFKYPEDDSNSLREVLSNKFKIDSKKIISKLEIKNLSVLILNENMEVLFDTKGYDLDTESFEEENYVTIESIDNVSESKELSNKGKDISNRLFLNNDIFKKNFHKFSLFF